MKIVIQGAGEVGSNLAKMLSLEANDITVIDNDQARLAEISSIAAVVAVSYTHLGGCFSTTPMCRSR